MTPSAALATKRRPGPAPRAGGGASRARPAAGRSRGRLLGTRDRLLKAARDLMSERGPERVSIRDIAGRAGVNLSQIYYHFGSKQALRSAVLYDAVAQFDPTLQGAAGAPPAVGAPPAARASPGARRAGREPLQRPRAPSGGDAASEIEAIVAGFIERLAELPVMPRLMLRELAREGPGLDRLARELITPRFRRIQAALRRGRREGTIRPGNARVQAASCVALSAFWFLLRPMLSRVGLDVLDPRDRRLVHNEVVEILRHGLLAPGSARARPPAAAARTRR